MSAFLTGMSIAVRLEHAELARGLQLRLDRRRLDLVELPFLQARHQPVGADGDVELALVGQHLAEDLGVPAGAGQQLDDRHVGLAGRRTRASAPACARARRGRVPRGCGCRWPAPSRSPARFRSWARRAPSARAPAGRPSSSVEARASARASRGEFMVRRTPSCRDRSDRDRGRRRAAAADCRPNPRRGIDAFAACPSRGARGSLPSRDADPSAVPDPGLRGTAAAQRRRRRSTGRLLRECLQLHADDVAGRRWSARNYPGGYTSYGSLSRMHTHLADLRRAAAPAAAPRARLRARSSSSTSRAASCR